MRKNEKQWYDQWTHPGTVLCMVILALVALAFALLLRAAS